MKIFLKRLLYLIIACLVIVLILDIFISIRLKKVSVIAQGEWPVWNDIYNGKINTDIIINGSSRAWVHFDPSMIERELNASCYNLGIDGQNFNLQYFRYSQLLRFNKKPKLVIQSLDDFSLSAKTELYNYEQFLPYMLFNKEIYKITKKYKAFSVLDFLIPGLRYTGRKDMINIAFEGEPRDYNGALKRINGYRGQDREWNNDLDEAQNKQQHIVEKIDEDLLATFNKYIEECKKNKIELIFVFSPEYIGGQNFVANHAEIIEMYRAIAIKNNITFFDFSNNYLSFEKKYFYNSSHLNIHGSQLFTKILVDSMKSRSNILGTLK